MVLMPTLLWRGGKKKTSTRGRITYQLSTKVLKEGNNALQIEEANNLLNRKGFKPGISLYLSQNDTMQNWPAIIVGQIVITVILL